MTNLPLLLPVTIMSDENHTIASFCSIPKNEPHSGTLFDKDQYPSNHEIPKLFRNLNIGEIEIKNRIALSPMCMFSSNDGAMNDWHVAHLGSFAIRGVGLIFSEVVSVSKTGRLSPQDAGLWSDDHIVPIRRVADFIHSQDACLGIQIGHGGRKSSTLPPWKCKVPGVKEHAKLEDGGWPDQVVGPSGIPFDSNMLNPNEMSKLEIEEVIQSFEEAAIRCMKADVDVLEIHGGHGYLLHEFASPISNHRKDEYGGSFENRVLFQLEIVKRVRKVWKKALFYRISAVEYVPGPEKDESTGDWLQWGIEQSIMFARMLKDAGIDLIDVSSGGNYNEQKIFLRPGYQVDYASKIKQAVPNILVGAVGLITKAGHAERVLEKDGADLILVGRELLRNPNFVMHAAEDLGVVVKPPVQYTPAYSRLLR